MKFTKATVPSSIPFGVYRINHDYLSSLKKNDDNIVDPTENDRYCGPVFSADCERGPVAFFAPISPDYETRTSFLLYFKDGVYADLIDFNKMIPCVDKRFLTQDAANKELIKFCGNTKNDLLHYADIVMQNVL